MSRASEKPADPSLSKTTSATRTVTTIRGWRTAVLGFAVVFVRPSSGWNPEMFPKKYRFFHRAIVRRRYFGIFFAIESEITTVAAVRDMRDDPKEIQRLLLNRRNR